MNFDNKILYPTGSPRLHTAFWLSFKQPKQEKTWDYLRWLDTQNGMITPPDLDQCSGRIPQRGIRGL